MRLVVVSNHMADAHLLVRKEVLMLRLVRMVLNGLNIHGRYFNVSDHISVEISLVYWN